MLVVHDGLNGFSTLVGGLVVFTGILTGITAVLARAYLTEGALNVAGAPVLRRLLIAFSCCTAFLAVLSLVPLAVAAALPGADTTATPCGAVAAVSVACALVVVPVLKAGPRR